MVIKKYISQKKIQARVKAIAFKISKDYKNKDLVILGVLNGAVIFCSDICRLVTVNHHLDFLKVTSYAGKKSSGKITFKLLPSVNLRNKHVLIVEDIIDTGLTIKILKKWVRSQKATDVRVCSLLVKSDNLEHVKNDFDYVGFEIQNHFVVGYGLDYDGAYRHLPYIGQLAGIE